MRVARLDDEYGACRAAGAPAPVNGQELLGEFWMVGLGRKLLLVRHCKASGQELDATLTEVGAKQAETLAGFLSDMGVDKIVSSTYRRAQQSIEPFATSMGLAIQIDHRLDERTLSASPIDNWREVVRDSFDDMDLRAPGGESAREVLTRGWACLIDLLDNGWVLPLAVTHGNLMALVLASLDSGFGYRGWKELSNPDAFILRDAPDGRFEFVRIWGE